MKKLLALCLVLALTLALLPAALADDDVPVLTIGSIIANRNLSNNEIFQNLEKKLNCKIEFTYYSTDNYSVMLADGSLPDIMLSRFEYLPLVLGSNLALNLEPYIDEYMPNLRNPLYKNTLELQQKLFPTDNNGIYFINPSVGIFNSKGGLGQYRGYIVRWDYYKELGCPEINNDDDYVNVLLQMQKNHPTTADGKSTWAFAVPNSLKSMGGYRSSWTSAVAVNLYAPYLYKASLYDNTLVNCYTDLERSSYWADMRFYNKLYRAGQFDVDLFTMSGDELDAKIAEGRYMGLHFVDDALYDNESKTDPNTLAGYVVVPSKGTILYADCMLMMGNGPTYHAFINAKSENKELAMKFYNELYDPDFVRTWYCGQKGIDWDYDTNGVPYMFKETIQKIATQDESFVGKGYSARDPYMTAYSPASLHPDGHFMNLLEESDARIDSQNPLQKDFAATYGVDYWIDALYNTMRSNNTDASETIIACMSDIPTDVKRILDSCNDVMYNAMPSLIMAESDEEFKAAQDEVLAQLKELHEEDQFAWYEAKWNAAKDIVMPYFNAAWEAQKATEAAAK